MPTSAPNTTRPTCNRSRAREATLSDTRRIALVEPYYGGSHRAWADGYAAHSAHDVEIVSLPAVHWKWRMHGGHVSLAADLERAVAERGPFDVVIASSMTNLPALLGTARATIAGASVVLYVHENQLTYPLGPDQREDLTYAMINWSSMVSADAVVFNSEFHRTAWFEALPAFLRRFPDHRRDDLIDIVRARSTVLPVGVDLRAIGEVEQVSPERPIVLWNQRWEHDKSPRQFVDAAAELIDDGVDFSIAVAGARPDPAPAELQMLRRIAGDRLCHDAEANVADYHRLLRRASVVVSTAHQEFFGVAIVEAIHAGAFPILPDRLVYPERIPPDLHDACLYRGRAGLVERLRRAVTRPDEAAAVAARLRSVTAEFDWTVVAPRYDELVAALT